MLVRGVTRCNRECIRDKRTFEVDYFEDEVLCGGIGFDFFDLFSHLE